MVHEICYMEIVTGDLAAATRFYGQVFGWAIEPMGENYALFKTGERGEGGFTPPMPGLEHGVCIYIKVDDIDAMLATITSAGGKAVTPKTKISDEYGYYGLFKDPHGNVIGLWSKN